MKISTKGRYALRLMLDLALHQEEGAVSLREASERQDISDKYLEQIVTRLSRGGMVRSVRGAGGGYLLTRRPEEYTVGEILCCTEGDLGPVDCAAGGECCGKAEHCVTVEVWQQIRAAVSGVVDHITLGDLVERYHQKNRVE